MKVLYIGHFTEGTGWSKAARDNVKSLQSVGVDVVCRNISLSQNSDNQLEGIMHLFNHDVKNVDYCVQHILPHFINYTDIFKKNIAYFPAGETSTIKYTTWHDNLKLVDEVWVSCKSGEESFIRDSIKNTHVIPHAFDIDMYRAKDNRSLNIGMPGAFKFYYIGDVSDRKNIDSIIKCFHSEFTDDEPVELILKINKFGMDDQSLHRAMTQMCDGIKKSLKIYRNPSHYRREIIIPSKLTESEIESLHKHCDCFVLPSHGEGFSLPSFDAMAFGKTPICSNDGGPRDFIDPENKDTGWLVEGVYDVCQDSNAAFDFINTGREEWFHPSHREIKKAMRYYYDNRDSIDRTSGLEQAKANSLEKIGNMMKERLLHE
jgi:glycosyltransferase involved in cell wall biosynthesis